MESIHEQFSRLNREGWPCSYGSSVKDTWLVFLSKTRDADLIEESNFEVALKVLGEIGGEGKDYAIFRQSHWACGWLETIIINPKSETLVEKAVEMENDLEEYALLDDGDYSEREYNAYCEARDSEVDDEVSGDEIDAEIEENFNGALDYENIWEAAQNVRRKKESLQN